MAKKLTKLEKEALAALPRIVQATQENDGTGYTFTDEFTHTYLVEQGLVEVNPDIKNEAGAIATRATQKGVETVMATDANKNEGTAVVEETGFAIETGIEIPAIKRGFGARTGASKYPFDKLEVGQSFFVPASEKRPDPVKALASTVASAMAKYDVPDLDEAGVQKTKEVTNPKTKEKRTVPATKRVRVFTIRAAEVNGTKGARIWRSQ